jgi:hypothetical protein
MKPTQFSIRDLLLLAIPFCLVLALAAQLRWIGAIVGGYVLVLWIAGWRRRWRAVAAAGTGLAVFAITLLVAWMQLANEPERFRVGHHEKIPRPMSPLDFYYRFEPSAIVVVTACIASLMAMAVWYQGERKSALSQRGLLLSVGLTAISAIVVAVMLACFYVTSDERH